MTKTQISELKSPPNFAAEPTVPWWQVGVMWFFAGGLGAVVLASFALLYTAIEHRDTVLPHDPQPTKSSTVPNTPTSPAMQARNHSATPPQIATPTPTPTPATLP